MNRTLKVLLVIVAVVGLLGYLTYITMSANEVECEVCVEFRGAVDCRKATGKDSDEATRTAAGTACGMLAGGVGSSIACQNTPPKSVTCESK
jgi:hypothetical protein